jgi:molybdopterin-synthase adenylyltransferase
MPLTDIQVERYARHILLPEIGGGGQAKIQNAKVLVVGAGGLGSPVIQYLAAAGVGTIGIVDNDIVDLSNLQRQIIHTTPRIGESKVESARATIREINPEVVVVKHQERLVHDNAIELISKYDIVADGCDNFATRFLIMDTCHLEKKTLVSGAILRFDGQLSVFKAYNKKDGDYPCYRCLFPKAPPSNSIPTCAEAGVLGAVCGTIGSLQAAEILKEIAGYGDSLAGSLLIFDGLHTNFRKIKITPDPKCSLCSRNATIKDLSAHLL